MQNRKNSARVALTTVLAVSLVLAGAVPASASTTTVVADDTYKWFYWIGFSPTR